MTEIDTTKTGAAGAAHRSAATMKPARSFTRPRATNSPPAATSKPALRAGVSTKTVYRLIPNKAALQERMVGTRLDRLVSELNLRSADHTDIEEALSAALMVCAVLALDGEVIALQRMVLQEAGKCSEIAGMYYVNGIKRTAGALADWLRVQQRRGLIPLDDADEAAGMLLGMVAAAPRRAAIFGGLPLPSRSQIEARARTCAALFLRGCQIKRFA